MGLSGGDSKSKNGKKKRGNAVLEAFTMMKSSDGWDDGDDYDEYYVKDGTRRRKENVSGDASRGGRKKKPERKQNDKGKPWK